MKLRLLLVVGFFMLMMTMSVSDASAIWNQPAETEGCTGPINPPLNFQATCNGSPACVYDPDPAPPTNQFRCTTDGNTAVSRSDSLYICRERAAIPNLICEHYLFSSDYYTCTYFGDTITRGTTNYDGVLFANCTRSITSPSVTLSGSPTSITTGQSSTLTWSTPNAGTGFVSGEGAATRRTDDGGNTWIPQTVLGATGGNFNDIHFLNNNIGWAVGGFQIPPETWWRGRIVKTVDGGSTWTMQYDSASGQVGFNSVHFSSSTHGWAGGSQGSGVRLMRTTDGGTVWSQIDTGITAWGQIHDVFSINDNTAWIAGGFDAGGQILYKTTNGGASWIPINTGTTERLFSIHFVNSDTGWAAGANGRILGTVNGGTTWTALPSGTIWELRDITFINSGDGWAVGSNGTILRTTNGGSTWTAQTSGTTALLFDSQFITLNTGWVVGANGTILRTANGGNTWQNQSSGSQAYFAVHMLSLPVSCSAPWTPIRTPNGSQVVWPTSTTSYTISCTNGTATGISNPVTITVSPPPDTTPPSVPTGVSATGVSSSQINVSWNASNDGSGSGVAGYRVYRNGVLLPGPLITPTSFSDTGLSPGTTYTYTISAHDVAGNPSAQSSPPASGQTLFSADTTDPTSPGTPVASAVSATQIALSWGASTDPTIVGETTSGLAGYRIYRNGSVTPVATVGAGVTAYTDSALTPSTAYTYYVSAYDNASNESAQSGPASATTPAIPTATISASPTSITLGQSTTLTWSSTNATSCNICSSAFCSGFLPTTGTQTVTPSSAGSFTYTAMCTGPGGTASSQPVIISVSVPPSPTVSLSATRTSLTLGQSTTLNWSSTNATSCTASGAWSGAQAVSGTQVFTPASGGTYTYTLSCSGSGGGPVSQQVTVSVVPPTAPVVTLSASPSSLTLGESTTLTWSSTNADSCSAPSWTGSNGSSGTEIETPTVTTTYTISCTGPGGTVPQSTMVTVSDPPPVISNGQPSGVRAGGTESVTLSVTTNEAAYCNYNQNTDVAFGDMSDSFTRDLARRTHTATISGLTDGTTYRYYVRCQDDPAGRENPSGYLIAFSVAAPSNALPIALFTTAPTTGTTPLTIAVDASGSTDPDGSIVQYRWTWGDFSLPDTIGPVTAVQVYSNPGTYTVTLRVVDDQGGSSTATQTITVSTNTPPPPPPPTTGGICIAACSLDTDCFGTDTCGPSGYCIAAGSGGPGPVRDNGTVTSLDGTIISPPAASFPSTTTRVIMSLTTDVNATCQYSSVADTLYDDSSMSQFTSSGSTNHSIMISGLGGLPTQTYNYNYFARCRDTQTGEVNTVDYPISFSIGGATLSSGPNPYLCMVNESFVRNGLPYFFNVCQPRCETSTDCVAPTPVCDLVRRVCVR